MALLLALSAALLYFLQPFGEASANEQMLALRLSEQGSTMHFEWDPAARPIRRAHSLSLEIADGGKIIRYPLDRDRMLTGELAYERQSNDVVATLRAFRGESESARAVVRSLVPALAAAPARTGANRRLRSVEQTRNRGSVVSKPAEVKKAKKSKPRPRRGGRR